MKFLFPSAWGFAALAIPVILFYLIKTRPKRRVVSTSLFWDQLAPQVHNTPFWRRLRRWISLLLQLLFLLALIFALAEPVSNRRSLQPVSTVYLLDPTASMAATDAAPSRWGQAVQTARERIGQMRAADEAAIILASDPPQVLSGWNTGKRALFRALDEAKPSTTGGAIKPTLALARNLVEGRPHGRVILLSDGVWEDAPLKEDLVGIEPLWISGDGVNAGITLFSARRSLAAPGEYQLAARVESRGSAPVSGTIEIFRDGARVDNIPLHLESGKPWVKTWQGRAEEGARFTAKLSGFPADRLSLDDHAEALLPVITPVSVEIVAPPNAFLDAAFQSLNQVAVTRCWPIDQLGTARPWVLYIFYKSLPPPDFAPEAMILIAPEASGPWGELRGPIESPLISDIQRKSELMRHAGIENVSLQAATEFVPAPGAEAFAESFGKPVIFGKWKGAKRWLVLAFDLESSDFVLRASFPILVANAVESLRPSVDTAPVAQLPGPVESGLLRPDAAATGEMSGPAPETRAWWGWWSGFPLWQLAAAFAVVWLLAEWRLYSRRITE